MSNKAVISIVDDDESVREATRGLMSALGFLAEAFASAEDFLKSERFQRTSCLIADMHAGDERLEPLRRMICSLASAVTHARSGGR